MGDFFFMPFEMILIALALIIVIMFVMIIIISFRLSSLRKRYVRMLNGADAVSLEDVFIRMQETLNELKKGQKEHEERFAALFRQLKTMKSHVGIHRYNAFNENGSDMSFSLAILDEGQSGVVLSGLHNRNETYLYAKPLENGKSRYTLSPEEKEAIILALKKEQQALSAGS